MPGRLENQTPRARRAGVCGLEKRVIHTAESVKQATLINNAFNGFFEGAQCRRGIISF